MKLNSRWFVVMAALGAMACGDKNEGVELNTDTSGGGGTDSSGTDDGTDGVDGTDSTSGDGTERTTGTDDSGTDGTDAAGPGPNFCMTDTDCSDGNKCYDSVCIIPPDEEVLLTNNNDDSAVAEPPNLSCVGEPYMPGAGGPDSVTLYGIVDRFGSGRQTIGIEVTIFRAEAWPPAECTSLPTAEQRECFRSVEPEKPEWKVVSTDPEVDRPTNPDQCERHKDCAPGYECVEISSIDYRCEPQFGLFEIPNVPTNTALVIRSRNAPSQALYENKWKDTYVVGNYLFSDKAEEGGRYNVNALMVSQGQWTTVPNTLGVLGGIKSGNGAFGGRIRDCHTDERRGYTMGKVSVGLENPGAATGYFNDNEYDTVPVVANLSTDIFGRFTIVDVPAGPNRLSAAAMINGAITSLGGLDFFQVPDSLVTVAYPGKLPIMTK